MAMHVSADSYKDFQGPSFHKKQIENATGLSLQKTKSFVKARFPGF